MKTVLSILIIIIIIIADEHTAFPAFSSFCSVVSFFHSHFSHDQPATLPWQQPVAVEQHGGGGVVRAVARGTDAPHTSGQCDPAAHLFRPAAQPHAAGEAWQPITTMVLKENPAGNAIFPKEERLLIRNSLLCLYI